MAFQLSLGRSLNPPPLTEPARNAVMAMPTARNSGATSSCPSRWTRHCSISLRTRKGMAAFASGSESMSNFGLTCCHDYA